MLHVDTCKLKEIFQYSLSKQSKIVVLWLPTGLNDSLRFQRRAGAISYTAAAITATADISVLAERATNSARAGINAIVSSMCCAVPGSFHNSSVLFTEPGQRPAKCEYATAKCVIRASRNCKAKPDVVMHCIWWFSTLLMNDWGLSDGKKLK